MLQKIKSKIFEWCLRSFQVDYLHALIKHRKNSLHQELIVRGLLKRFPLTELILLASNLLICISCSRFDSLDFFSSLGFSMLDGLDKVIRLHDGSVRFHLEDIFIDELAVWKRLAGDYINNINLAFIVFESFIIKENVLGAIVGLVDEKNLPTILVQA